MASETLAKIDRAYDVVSALCEGKREWLMSIPARPDHDPDLIIGDALLAARNEIARISRELEEARERERGARRAFEVAMEYVHESLYGDILVRLAEEGIDLTALSTLQEVNDV